MLTIEEIRHLMADRRVRVVADATGIHHQTIYTLLDDTRPANPSYNTLKALSDYLSGGQAA